MVAGDPMEFLAVVYGGRTPEEAGLRVEGDQGALARLAGAFRRPEPLSG